MAICQTDTSWMLEADLMAGLHVEQEESSLTIESDALEHAEGRPHQQRLPQQLLERLPRQSSQKEARAAADIEAQKVRLQSSMGRSLARLDRLFEAADSDGDGSFDRREFRGLVAALGSQHRTPRATRSSTRTTRTARAQSVSRSSFKVSCVHTWQRLPAGSLMSFERAMSTAHERLTATSLSTG